MIFLNNADFNITLIQIMNPFPKATPDQQLTAQEQQVLQMLQQNPELMKQYQQQLAQQQGNSQQGPINSEKYLEVLKAGKMQQYLDQEGGLLIQPKQHFVIKFYDKRTNEKIFVNVVSHEVIDHPEEKVLVDFENQPGLRIPMSMGRVREDTDKSNNACKVVDVVLNPKIVDTMESNPDIMAFTVQIVGNYLLEKYKIAVSEDKMKKVKGLKYKGSKPEVQRVKGKKSPKIQQLHEETNVSEEQKQKQEQLFNELNNPSKKKLIRPDFGIWAHVSGRYQEYSLDTLKDINHLKVIFDLPHLLNSKGIHLQASQRILYLFVRGIYQVCLKLPMNVSKFECKFARRSRKLEIILRPPIKEQTQSKSSSKPLKQAPSVQFENELLDELV